jgi:transposase
VGKSKDVATQIRKATRRRFSAEEKNRIVLEGFRGELSISEICRREGIASSIYYKWPQALLEADKNGPTEDTLREANSFTKGAIGRQVCAQDRFSAISFFGRTVRSLRMAGVYRG